MLNANLIIGQIKTYKLHVFYLTHQVDYNPNKKFVVLSSKHMAKKHSYLTRNND